MARSAKAKSGLPSSIHTSGGIPEAEDFWHGFAAELKAGQVVAVNDVERDPRTACKAAAYGAHEVRSFACAPLAEAGRMAAILWVQDNRPREWSHEELVFIREIADRTWAAVEACPRGR